MKTYNLLLLIIILNVSSNAYAWRIEKNVLIIEKGDNLTEISHSLLGRGTQYDLIWKRCIDTLISRNPNLIYEGMRFSIDSLVTNKNESTKYVPIILYEKKSEEESHLWDYINALITLTSVGLAAYLADIFLKRNDKRRVAFDLFSEFNTSEMHLHRAKADNVLAKNTILETELKEASDETKEKHPTYFRNFNEFDKKQIDDKRSLFIILNFYKKIELLRSADRIDSTLIPILFGEIFHYWWEYCFDKFRKDEKNEEIKWESIKLVTALNGWFYKKADEEKKEYWKEANRRSYPKLIIEKKEEMIIKLNMEDIDARIRNTVAQILNENSQNR